MVYIIYVLRVPLITFKYIYIWTRILYLKYLSQLEYESKILHFSLAKKQNINHYIGKTAKTRYSGIVNHTPLPCPSGENVDLCVKQHWRNEKAPKLFACSPQIFASKLSRFQHAEIKTHSLPSLCTKHQHNTTFPYIQSYLDWKKRDPYMITLLSVCLSISFFLGKNLSFPP